jgi:pimeloyl-ACP methyl ester carboxylesterase
MAVSSIAGGSMIESSIRVEGLGIRYLEEGAGPVVLLLHGATLGLSADSWRSSLAPLAAQGFRVIAYDQPGFGLSDDPPDFAAPYRQQFIARFLDAMSIRGAVLAGHSQAGGFAVSAALQTPQRYRGIVVLGTGSLLPPLTNQAREPEAPEGEPALEDTRALLKANLYRHELITPDLLADFHRMSIARNATNAVRRAKAATVKPGGDVKPLWQRLGDVPVPLMLMYGANDRGSPAERVPLARERYPHLAFHLFENCHHIVQWDCPDHFIRITTDFLKKLPPA